MEKKELINKIKKKDKRIKETNNWFFGKVSNTEQPLDKLTKRGKKTIINKFKMKRRHYNR